jgi:hypothetical protein
MVNIELLLPLAMLSFLWSPHVHVGKGLLLYVRGEGHNIPPLPVPFFAIFLHCGLVAIADAILGMYNIDLLLLHGSHTIADTIVLDEWHTIVPTLVE